MGLRFTRRQVGAMLFVCTLAGIGFNPGRRYAYSLFKTRDEVLRLVEFDPFAWQVLAENIHYTDYLLKSSNFSLETLNAKERAEFRKLWGVENGFLGLAR